VILQALAPAGVLDLAEHESLTIDLVRGDAESVLSQAAAAFKLALAKGLISITTNITADGITKFIVSASSIVGFAASAPSSAGGILVRVRPKVGTRRMLELAAVAGMLPNWTPDGAFLSETLEDALLEWTLRAYARSLNRLISMGGLRNSHERIQRELNGRLRGRILVGPWLRNVARGAPHRIPAEFPTLERDHASNRLLRWALHLSVLASRRIPNGHSLTEQLRWAERHFGGVSIVRPRGHGLDLRSLPPNHRHYGEALKLAQYVCQNINFGGEIGNNQGTAVAVDMNAVYERAFFHGLQEIEPTAVRQEAWPVKLTSPGLGYPGLPLTRSTEMIPDVYVSSDGVSGRLPIIIDTKWKKVTLTSPAKLDSELLLHGAVTTLVKVRPEDLYQATAYALEALQRLQKSGSRCSGCVTALVYPALGDMPPYERELVFGGARILVRLVGWNVAQDVRSGIKIVWDGLRASADIGAVSEQQESP